MRSDVVGMVWPPIKMNEAATLAALSAEIERSEWLDENELSRLQHLQLSALLKHHSENTPSFADKLSDARLAHSDIVDRVSLRRLPLLTRSQWQDLGDTMFSTKVPQQHGKPNKLKTSGSTGEPVVVWKTMMNGMLWAAHSIRDHKWHQRNHSMRMISIRADIHQRAEVSSWGYPMSMLYDTGPGLGLPITVDVKQQLEEIRKFDPEFMITYPNNLSALLDLWESEGYGGNLKHIKCLGETVSDSLRSRTMSILGLYIEDGYSSNEAGTIALHCGHHYHTMDDSLIVEVINDQGDECEPGEIGRIVITDLHNFSTPVIRYQIGDHAERGGPCPCGRGYGTLRKIIGRERNLMIKPDGTRHWPLTGMYGFRDVANIKQYQMIQHTINDIELKLHAPNGLTADQESKIIAMARSALGYDFDITINASINAIPRGLNGKFEEFICRIS